MLPLLLSVGAFSAHAQDEDENTSWRRVAFLDFGGNSTSDPDVRSYGLQDYEGETSIKEFSDELLTYANDLYFIAKHADPNSKPGDWCTGGDHTYENDKNKGYFLMMDTPQGCSPVLRAQNACAGRLDYPTDYLYEKTLTQNLCPGVTFKFEAWVANIANQDMSTSGSAIALGIYDANGDNLWQSSTVIPSPSVEGETHLNWEKVGGTFSVPSSADLSRIFFRIYPMQGTTATASSGGYDFGLDDIAIYISQPKINFTSTEWLYKAPGTISASLDGTSFFADMNDVAYYWEYSEDGQTGWTKVGEGTYASSKTFDYNIASFDKTDKTGSGNGYYRLTLATKDNINSITDESVCCVRDIYQINETKNKVKLVLCEGGKQTIDGVEFTDKNDGKTILTSNNYEVTTEVIFNTITSDTVKSCVGQAYPVGSSYIYNTVGETYPLDDEVVTSKRVNYSGEHCDSTTLKKTLKIVAQDIDEADWEHFCAGGTKKASNGILYDVAGTYRDTTKGACLWTALTFVVHPTADTTLVTQVCEGSVYKDKTYTEAGEYTLGKEITKTHFGCDSTIYETVIVSSHTEASLPDVELCQSDFGEGKTAYTFGGKNYFNDTNADLVLDLENKEGTGVNGCDSITKVHVTIHPLIHEYLDTLICLDQILFGVEWNIAGKYTKDFSYTSQTGCDSIVTWNITVLDIQLKLRAEFDQTSVCEGSSATLIVDLVPSDVPLTWEPELTSRNPLRPVVSPTESTIYVAHAKNSAGCHATDSISISVNPVPSLTIDTVDNMGRTITFNVTGGTPEYTYWVGSIGSSQSSDADSKNAGKQYTPNGNMIEGVAYGKHELRVIDANGCASVDSFSIEPTPIEPALYLSPNGDGVADTWEVKGIDAYPEARVSIYDRYGRLLFTQKGYDNMSNSFTGVYNGNLLPSTDYWYVIDLESVDKQYIGHFTLLR